jgi:hypothetical protein
MTVLLKHVKPQKTPLVQPTLVEIGHSAIQEKKPTVLIPCSQTIRKLAGVTRHTKNAPKIDREPTI